MWGQKEIIIKNKNRGFHLITNEIIQNLPEIKKISIGLLHIFIKHTSASLTLNENSDQSVRIDFESHLNNMVPEGKKYYLKDGIHPSRLAYESWSEKLAIITVNAIKSEKICE